MILTASLQLILFSWDVSIKFYINRAFENMSLNKLICLPKQRIQSLVMMSATSSHSDFCLLWGEILPGAADKFVWNNLKTRWSFYDSFCH